MFIFVSHSTDKTDENGKQRLLAIRNALMRTAAGAPTGHDVLLDFKRLRPASKWRSQLDEWMATCHAAVLVLTPRALTSDWVLKEATILAHRAALDDNFLLFPVLLDGVTGPQLSAKDSRFSPSYLDALQRVASQAADGIAAEVLAELAELKSPPVTPLDELATTLAIQVKSADDAQLEVICRKITGKPVKWRDGQTRAQHCAREIARAVVVGMRGEYDSVAALIGDLMTAGLTKEAGTRALNLVSPLWVDGGAAAPLTDVAKRNLCAKADAAGVIATSAAAINGDYVPTFTAEQYLRRVYMPKSATFRTIDGGTSEKRLDELTARIRAVVRDSTPTLKGAEDAKVETFLANLKAPYFIVLPPPLPDAPLLSELQSRFRRVTFILQSEGDTLTSGTLPPGVVPLSPPVDLDLEQTAVNDFEAARESIGAIGAG